MARPRLTRRGFVRAGVTATGSAGLLLASRSRAAAPPEPRRRGASTHEEPGIPGRHYRPVVTPNGAVLPWSLVDGVKVYHLLAEEVEHELAPGLRGRMWGYNGRVHGPTIEAVEGDRVRIYVTNRLAAPTTIHWHGVLLPNGMDGVGGLTQRVIAPGQTFRYEWTFRQHGTLMYHSHHDEAVQMAMGMLGLVIVHPRRPARDDAVDRDFAIMLSEWDIVPGAARPDPNEMLDFNVFTMNARAFPGTAPLVCKTGDRVRIRLANLSTTDHHPIHLHGHRFTVTATDGGPIPAAGRWPESTVLVPTGSTRDIEFVADAPGDWLLHCHMTHHMMNQMGHDLPNMIGVKTGSLDARARQVVPGYMTMGQTGMANMANMEMPVPDNSIPMRGTEGPFDHITVGGMATLVKVRDRLSGDEDPGWYEHPPGTVAHLATPESLRRDGVDT